MKFSIGEFSQITQLSIKSLRLYHDKEILVPSEVDDFTKYRYYNEENYRTAAAIKLLKDFDFSLAEIKEIIDECDDETDIVEHLQEKLKLIQSKIIRYKEISRSIENIIKNQQEADMLQDNEFQIEEKEVDTMLIAGYRMKARYEEVGKGISLICKKMGRHICGKAMNLYYDGEYKENNADFEPCFPVRKGKSADGIEVRELKGGKCISLIHKGPYDTLGNSYKKIIGFINENKIKTALPNREVYIKGPGMIFKGNPKNYLTEIQMFVEE